MGKYEKALLRALKQRGLIQNVELTVDLMEQSLRPYDEKTTFVPVKLENGEEGLKVAKVVRITSPEKAAQALRRMDALNGGALSKRLPPKAQAISDKDYKKYLPMLEGEVLSEEEEEEVDGILSRAAKHRVVEE